MMTFNERCNGGPIRLIFLSLMGAVGVRAADCVRERRQPAARALGEPRPRDVGPHLARRDALADRPAAAGRERAALRSSAALLGLALAHVGVQPVRRGDAGRRQAVLDQVHDGRAGLQRSSPAVCLGTGVVFGLAPALHVSKTDLNEVLKEGGRSGSSGMRARRWTSALIVAELALTLVLLAGAGLMMRSFSTLYRLDVGVETAHLSDDAAGAAEPEVPDDRSSAALSSSGSTSGSPGSAGIQAATIATNMPLGGGFAAASGGRGPYARGGRAGAARSRR